MFVPFQSNSDELTMAADNAAMTLVENVLIDSRHADSRLAMASPPASIIYSGADTPGIIDHQKYMDLMNAINPGSPGYSQDNVIKEKKYLGMGYGQSVLTPDENYYRLQIELKTSQNPLNDPIYTAPISPDGMPEGTNVGQSRRFVYVQDAPGDYTMAILTVRVW